MQSIAHAVWRKDLMVPCLFRMMLKAGFTRFDLTNSNSYGK